MDKNKYLLKDIISTYNRLLFLEENYKKMGVDRLQIRKNILKTMKELTIELENFNENVQEKLDFWSYHPIGDRKCIQIPDNQLFLTILLKLANSYDNKYAIRRVDVLELLPDNDKCYSVKIRWVDILSDENTLNLLKRDKPIIHKELIEILNKLTIDGHSFIMLSNLIKEYDELYLKEKIATITNNDIIVSVRTNDRLDICLNKLITYMTRFGSDFSHMDIDKTIINVDRIKKYNKKRQINNYKYIKYND